MRGCRILDPMGIPRSVPRRDHSLSTQVQLRAASCNSCKNVQAPVLDSQGEAKALSASPLTSCVPLVAATLRGANVLSTAAEFTLYRPCRPTSRGTQAPSPRGWRDCELVSYLTCREAFMNTNFQHAKSKDSKEPCTDSVH